MLLLLSLFIFFAGFITETAKVLYKMELAITVSSISMENVSDEYGKREHVVFNIVAKKIQETRDDAPPTFVAQTKKHGERQILQEVTNIHMHQIYMIVARSHAQTMRIKWK